MKTASLFNAKIRRGIRKRKKLFENLIINTTGLDRKKKLIWFHSASLGEFEQAKPIIEKLYKERKVNILVTFFSPSGYENSLNYPYADLISYLPLDTTFNIRRFVLIAKPALVILMRYDIWPNLIWHLSGRKIPCLIVDATMRENSKRRLPVALGFHKAVYKYFTKILTVSHDDLENFKRFDVNEQKLKVVGDTRFDRVYQKSLLAREKKLFSDGFFYGKKVFVFGSSWESDEDVILPASIKMLKYDKDFLIIIAPHEPTVVHIEKIENYFRNYAKTIRFSYLNNYKDERVIIIDSIGVLLTLYYYADAAYVGGSFKQGIHNVLEPAVYGIPVLFGPKIENSREAKFLSNNNGGIIIKNKKSAFRVIRSLFINDNLRKELGKKSKQFVLNNIGATEKIIKEIANYL